MTNDVMFARHTSDCVDQMCVKEEIGSNIKGWSADGEIVKGRSFMVTTSESPMNEKERDLLILLHISSSSYNSILFDIDDVYAYLNDLLIYMSSDVEKTEAELYEARNKIEEENSRVEILI